MAKLRGYIVVISRNGSYGNRYPLSNTECFFGQSNDCDVRVHVSNVAKRHCVITAKKDEQATICNLSGQVTLVNGIPIGSEQHLRHGDVITVGDRHFRWEYPDSSLYPASPKSVKNIQENIGPMCMVKVFKAQPALDGNVPGPSSPKRRKTLEADIRLENSLSKPVNKLLLGVTQPASRPKSYTTFKLLRSASKRKSLTPASKTKRAKSLPPVKDLAEEKTLVKRSLIAEFPTEKQTPTKRVVSTSGSPHKQASPKNSPDKSVTTPKVNKASPNKSTAPDSQKKSPSLKPPEESVTEDFSKKSPAKKSPGTSPKVTPSKDTVSPGTSSIKTSAVKKISFLANPLMTVTTPSVSPTSITPSQRLRTLRGRQSKSSTEQEEPITPRGRPSRKSSIQEPVPSTSALSQNNTPGKTLAKTPRGSSSRKSFVTKKLPASPSPKSEKSSPAKTPGKTPRVRPKNSLNFVQQKTPPKTPRGGKRKSSVVQKSLTPTKSSPTGSNLPIKTPPKTPRGRARKSFIVKKTSTPTALPSPTSGNSPPKKTPTKTPKGRKSSIVPKSNTPTTSSPTSRKSSTSTTPLKTPRGGARKSSVVKKPRTPAKSSTSGSNSPTKTPPRCETPRSRPRKSSIIQKSHTPSTSLFLTSASSSPTKTPAKTPKGKARKSSIVKKSLTPPMLLSTSGSSSPTKTPAKTPRGRPRKSSIVKKSPTPTTSLSTTSTSISSTKATPKVPRGRTRKSSIVKSSTSTPLISSPSLENESLVMTKIKTPRSRPSTSSVVARKSGSAEKTVLANPLLKTTTSKPTPGRKSKSLGKMQSPTNEQMEIDTVSEMEIKTPTRRSSKKSTVDERTPKETPSSLSLQSAKHDSPNTPKRRQTRSSVKSILTNSPRVRASVLANPLLKITLNDSPQSTTTTPVGRRSRRSAKTPEVEVDLMQFSVSTISASETGESVETSVAKMSSSRSPSVEDSAKSLNKSRTPSVNVSLLRRKSKSLTKSPSPKLTPRKTRRASSVVSSAKSVRSVSKSRNDSMIYSSSSFSMSNDNSEFLNNLNSSLTKSPMKVKTPNKSSSNTPSVCIASSTNKSLSFGKSPSPKTPKSKMLVPDINIISPSPNNNSQVVSPATLGNSVAKQTSPSVSVASLRRKSRSLAKTPSPIKSPTTPSKKTMSSVKFTVASPAPSTSNSAQNKRSKTMFRTSTPRRSEKTHKSSESSSSSLENISRIPTIQTPIPNKTSILRESLHWPINVEEALNNMRSSRKSLNMLSDFPKCPETKGTPRARRSSTKIATLAKIQSETKRKLDNDFEARAERAAKKLKMETPKSLSKNKVAALLVCHGRSPKKPDGQEEAKKPLWSDVLKSHLSTAKKKQQMARQSMPVASKKIIRPQKPFVPSLEIPKSFRFNSTGHANSPESIFITKKSNATPEFKGRTRKHSISKIEDASVPQLEGVSQLFKTPGKPIVSSLKTASSIKKPQNIRVRFSLHENQASPTIASSKRYIGTPIHPKTRTSMHYNSIVEESPLAEDIISHSSSSKSSTRKSRGSMRSVNSFDFSAYSPSSPTLQLSKMSGISGQMESSSELDSESESPKRKRDMPLLDSSGVSRSGTRKLSFAVTSNRRSQSNVESYVSVEHNARHSQSSLFGSFTDDSNFSISSKVTRKRGNNVSTDTNETFRFNLEASNMLAGSNESNVSGVHMFTPGSKNQSLSRNSLSAPISPGPSTSTASLNVSSSTKSRRSSSRRSINSSLNATSDKSTNVLTPTKLTRSVRSLLLDQVSPVTVKTSSTSEIPCYSDSEIESSKRPLKSDQRVIQSESIIESFTSPTRSNRKSGSTVRINQTFDGSSSQKVYSGTKRISSTPKKDISADQSQINSPILSPEKHSSTKTNQRVIQSESIVESFTSPTRSNRKSGSSVNFNQAFDGSCSSPKVSSVTKRISSTPKQKEISAEHTQINSPILSPEKHSNISLDLGNTTDYSFTKSNIVFESTQLNHPSSTPRKTSRKNSVPVRMNASDPTLIITDSPVPVATVKPSSRKKNESMVSNMDFTSLPDLTLPQEDGRKSIFTNLAFARASEGFNALANNQASMSGYSSNASISSGSSRRKQKSSGSPKSNQQSYASKSGSPRLNDTSFNFSSVKTPHVPKEMLVSPLNRISNRVSDFKGVKTMFQDPEKTPSYVDVRGMRRLLRTTQASTPPANYTNIAGIKALFEAPPHTPDYTNVSGLRNLYKDESRVNVKGVRRGFTGQNAQSSPSLVGIEVLFESPSKPTVMVPPMTRLNSETGKESTERERLIENVAQSSGAPFSLNSNDTVGVERAETSQNTRTKRKSTRSRKQESESTMVLETETTARATRNTRRVRVVESEEPTARLRTIRVKSNKNDSEPSEDTSTVENRSNTRVKPIEPEIVETDIAGPSRARKARGNPATSSKLAGKPEKRKVSPEDSEGSEDPPKKTRRGKALDKTPVEQNSQAIVESKPAPLNKRGRKRVDSVEVPNEPLIGTRSNSRSTRQDVKKAPKVENSINTQSRRKVNEPVASNVLELKPSTSGKKADPQTRTKRGKSMLVEEVEVTAEDVKPRRTRKSIAPKSVEQKLPAKTRGGKAQEEHKITEQQEPTEFLEPQPRALRRKGRENIATSESETAIEPKRQKKNEPTASKNTKAANSKKVQFHTNSPEQPPNKRGRGRAKAAQLMEISPEKMKEASKIGGRKPRSTKKLAASVSEPTIETDQPEVPETNVNKSTTRQRKTRGQPASKISPQLQKMDKATKKKSPNPKAKQPAKTRKPRASSSSDEDVGKPVASSTARSSSSFMTLTPTIPKIVASKSGAVKKRKSSLTATLKTKALPKLKSTKKKMATPSNPSPPVKRTRSQKK